MDSPSFKVLKETQNALSLEFVLAQPSTPKRPPFDEPAEGTKSPSITAIDIERKLENAAERRRSFTLERQQSLAAKISKIEEVAAKKAQLDAEFIQSTKEALEQKLETVGEKRDAHLNQLKEKVKERLEKIQEIQQSKENDDLEKPRQLKASIEEKLNQASANREENLQNMVKRLQEHEEAVARTCAAQKEQLESLRDKINQQLALAAERREAELQKIKDSAKEEEKKVEMVRQKKEALMTANTSGVEDMEQN